MLNLNSSGKSYILPKLEVPIECDYTKMACTAHNNWLCDSHGLIYELV